MALRKTLHLPMGYALTLTTDAVSSGYYTRLGNPGGTQYAPTAVAVSTSPVVGPFNEPRDYIIDVTVGDITYETAFSGMFTAVDDAAKANLAAPTFTGTVAGVNPFYTATAYATDGAIAVAPGIAKLTKAGVGAYTLAAPTAGQEGYILHCINTTANAHVITATGLINDGVVGGSKNTITFGAFVGASVTLVAIGLKWSVVSINVVVIA